ncbi:MAG: LysM peptidoglycan-binding domain-containing protein, partial [Candidatus Neomarinimicrobiota bacterium]
QAPAPAEVNTLPAPAEDLVAPVSESAVPTDAKLAVDDEMPLDGEDALGEGVVPEGFPDRPIVIPREEYAGIEQEPEWALHPDSATYMYLIRPDDYLTKIAWQEYGNPNEWRRIYSWNRDRIGSDPNLIYPYHELALYKPKDEIERWDYDYIIHVVEEGESLWSIAGMEYGDEIAWSVLFWDNEEALNANAGMLRPGMELRIRTRLWSANE